MGLMTCWRPSTWNWRPATRRARSSSNKALGQDQGPGRGQSHVIPNQGHVRGQCLVLVADPTHLDSTALGQDPTLHTLHQGQGQDPGRDQGQDQEVGQGQDLRQFHDAEARQAF